MRPLSSPPLRQRQQRQQQQQDEGEKEEKDYKDDLVGLSLSLDGDEEEYGKGVSPRDLSELVRERIHDSDDEEDVDDISDIETGSDQGDIADSQMEAGVRGSPLRNIMNELEETRSIMHDNIDAMISRGEKLDDLIDRSSNLEVEAKQFHRYATRLNRWRLCANCPRNTAQCVCAQCSACSTATVHCLQKSMNTLTSCLCGKSLLFDNVLADTENAFQALAKLLHTLHTYSTDIATWKWFFYASIGFWCQLISELVAFTVVLISSLVLILPSFFTLLIVRTTTVEKESKAFGGELCGISIVT